MRRKTLLASVLAGVLVAGLSVVGADAAGRDDKVARAFEATTRSTAWAQVARIPLKFPTYHPQGFALVGDLIYLSSVEVLEAPVPYPVPVDGYDRTPGKGIGHVFVLDRQGRLLKDIRVGEGTAYHPGGIDYDGENVWVPTAEYRPNSRAVVYKINPRNYRVTEQFRVRDHVGGVVRDRRTGLVHGVSWGSRTLYEWTASGKQLAVEPNQSHLLDYQDCDYVSRSKQLCGGVTGLKTATGGSFELGGLALLDLNDDNRILHEIPFPAYSAAGHSVTRNPVALEVDGKKLRLFTAPDDGEGATGTELLVYESPIS
ncbi:DUF6454 family protein [Streptomyces sp. SID13031]|uniref:DUF6454 family protein n=1 Tax=Streptomyces sp. SID13031 TaxID=2706046 RepID=UPI0013CC1A27|nr:DUF6454 family protein [Streptomyces sp. SID13031]NEA34236.1 hypothetical protein [Streptomyces sp. SID13031]